MTGAFVILAVTLLVGVVLYLTRDRNPGPQAEPELPETEAEEECCGRHLVCDKREPLSEPLYFDDEELDRFSGREPSDYSPEEVEEFRQVLYTLLPADVYPWGASLTVRDIALPAELRDEWIMLCNDTTTH